MAGEVHSFRYKAFLSYSHHDRKWVEAFHRALEGYKIGDDLVGRVTPAGPVPKTLRPIFRDRDDFAAGHSLTEQTLAALEGSQFLIVLCSPNSAASNYVNEEIRRFKAMGRAEQIVAIIVDGEPGDPTCECFPAALRFKLGPDGALTDEKEEPIAADARSIGDGKALALQKVVAALIAVPLDELRKRDAIADSFKIKTIAAAAGVFIVVAMAAGYFMWHATEQRRLEAALIEEQRKRDDAQTKRDEEHRKQLAAMQADYQALTLKLLGISTASAAPGQPQAVGEAVAATAQGAADGDPRLKRALDLLKEQKIDEASKLLREVAEEKESNAKTSGKEAAAAYRHLGAIAGLGDPKRALDAYQKAADLDPADINSQFWVGWIQKERGFLEEGERRFQHILANSEGADRDWHRYWARISMSDIRSTRGDIAGAMRGYRDALTIAEARTKAAPDNRAWLRDLSVSYDKIGDVLYDQSKLNEALASYRESLAIAERLIKAEPDNLKRQRDLSVSFNKIGDVLNEQDNPTEALKTYRDSLAIVERISKTEPNNAEWLRDIAVCYERIGHVLAAQNKNDEALASYRRSYDISERLAKIDPGNASWQRDLSVANERIGDIYLAQGNLDGAVEQYLASLGRMIPMRDRDPTNMGLRRTTSVTLNKIGDALAAKKNNDEALKRYEDALAIRQQLAAFNPDNAGWQRDLSGSHIKVGDLLSAQHDLAGALNAYRESAAIRLRLARAEPDNAKFKEDLKNVVGKVGSLAYQFVLTRSFAKALEASDEAIAISPDEVWLYTNKAHALLFLGQIEDARALYLKYRGTKEVQEDKTWEVAILEDLKEMDDAGLKHPLLDELRQQFAAPK